MGSILDAIRAAQDRRHQGQDTWRDLAGIGTSQIPPHTHSITGDSTYDLPRLRQAVTPIEVVAFRLGFKEGHQIPFDFIEFYRLKDRPAMVTFIVHNSQPLIIEEDADLFPSDNLITKLRVLIG